MPKPDDRIEKQVMTLIHTDDNLTDLLYSSSAQATLQVSISSLAASRL